MKQSELQRNVRQVVAQIVALAQPLRVILFGSAVSGKMGPDSDLDFLVVVPDDRQPAEIMDLLNTGVRPRVMPCDFLVVTPSLLERYGNTPGLVYREVLQNGREVYAV